MGLQWRETKFLRKRICVLFDFSGNGLWVKVGSSDFIPPKDLMVSSNYCQKKVYGIITTRKDDSDHA